MKRSFTTILSVVLAAVAHVNCWTAPRAFVSQRFNNRKGLSSQQLLLFSTLDDRRNAEQDLFRKEASAPLKKQQQLWLDLRDTAIRPNEALAFLEEFLFDDEESSSSHDAIIDLVDRIIVTEETFENMIQSGQTSDRILYTSDGGALLIENSKETQQSVVRGKMLLSKQGRLDPTSAFGVLEGGHDWVLVDTISDQESVVDNVQLFTDQVESLVQILSASPLLMMEPFETNEAASSLILSPAATSTSASCSVAVTCPTQEVLVSLDRCLQAQSLLANSVTTQETDMGILLPGSIEPQSSSMTTALVLPFDLRLWRAASELRSSSW